MTLDLYREPSTERCTIGRLAVNGRFTCWTCEDVVRDGPKVAHETAIAPGRYEVVITKSQRFGRMLPLIVGVPEFQGVRIHAGNTAEDTSGCVLVGLDRTPYGVYRSRVALEVLQAQIADAIARGERVWLVIHPAVQKGSFSV